MSFCSCHLGEVLGSLPRWRALGPGERPAASSPPWRDVLVTHVSLEMEALALSRKPGDRDREDYVQMAQSLQGESLPGPEGKLIKDLIQPTRYEKH